VNWTDVFLSRPTVLSPAQASFCQTLVEMLGAEHLTPRTLGVTDYPATAPLGEVLKLMRSCKGALVLGLNQLNVTRGTFKPGTSTAKEVSGVALPTPWNQIEAGIAVALGLPLLLVREPGVEGGVFDVGSSDRFVHQATLSSDWLASQAFRQPFESWVAEVRETTSL
jgi:hypothetical protein